MNFISYTLLIGSGCLDLCQEEICGHVYCQQKVSLGSIRDEVHGYWKGKWWLMFHVLVRDATNISNVVCNLGCYCSKMPSTLKILSINLILETYCFLNLPDHKDHSG